MDTLFGIAVVGLWIAISVVGLKRAYVSRGPSPQKPKVKGGATGSGEASPVLVTAIVEHAVTDHL